MSDKDESDEPEHEIQKSPISARKAKKLTKLKEYLSKQESLKNARKVSGILKKKAHDRTEDEKKVLAENGDIVKRIHKNKERRLLSEQRVLETEDSEQVLQQKCQLLAKEIQQSKHTVIYTGAGISTAASIPDYRGPQGVWTLLQKGEQLTPQDLSDAEPTITHMCIKALQRKGHVSHVVSQNCDGLHLRSGLPRTILSEVHGNMYIEVCYTCKPHREYIRLFDVTEKTGVRRHNTDRLCKKCGGKLQDTIVHFGEKGRLKSPYRWKEAVRAANNSDLILCLGSSLKILKKYSCLWCMDRARNKRPKLVIVNLQWTPKDSDSFLKVNGKCDEVLRRVMEILNYEIPVYSRDTDPIFTEAVALEDKEQNSTSKKILERPDSLRGVPLRTMPPSPTLSSSSDSDSSATSPSSSDFTDTSDTESDDEEIDEKLSNRSDLSHLSFRQEQFNSYANGKLTSNSPAVKHKLDISSIISKVKDRLNQETEKDAVKTMTKDEMFLQKSQQICNEAKRAMQLKSNTAERFDKQYIQTAQCYVESSNNSINAGQQVLGTNKNGFHKDEHGISDQVKQIPSVLHTVSSKPDTKESVISYEEKLKYLQTLQSQLQALKQKQQILKEKECDPYMDSVAVNDTRQAPHQQVWIPNTGTNSVAYKWEEAHVNTVQQNVQHHSTQIQPIKEEQYGQPSVDRTGSSWTQKQIQNYLTKEQNMNKDLIESQLKGFEKEKAEMKRLQENDHRRMYQQFVIQLQVAEQAHLGEQKKSEMIQAFQAQQKLMVDKQTVQLQELFKNHQAEQKQLTNKIEKRQKEIDIFVKSVQLTSPRHGLSIPETPQQEQNLYSSSNPYHSQSQVQVTVQPHSSTVMYSGRNICSPPKKIGMLSPQALISPGSTAVMGNSNTHVKTEPAHQPTGQGLSSFGAYQQSNNLQYNDHGYQQRNASENGQTPINAKHSTQVTTRHVVSHDHLPVVDKNVVQKETKIPGFSELVEGIITCETCTLLKNYGMSKTQCSDCDTLRMKYGIGHMTKIAQSTRVCNDQAGQVFTESAHSFVPISVTPSAVHTSISQSEHQKNLREEEKLLAMNNFSFSHNVFNTEGDTQYASTHTAPNYLNVTPVSGRELDKPDSKVYPVSMMAAVPSYQTHPATPNYVYQTPSQTTSSVRAGQLECPESSDQELSPVIPYASNKVSNTSQASVIPGTKCNISIEESGLAKHATDDGGLAVNVSSAPMYGGSDSGLAKLADVTLNVELQESKQKEMFETILYAEKEAANAAVDKGNKSDGAIFRPRSQSAVSVGEGGGAVEKRQVRSHSQDGLVGMNPIEEMTSAYDIKETGESAAKIGKKRKSSSNVSVPGWFGKGLNLKKKRKY